ncbi:hypothetical protein FB45DRAFT_882788 [Roridomyces roridus]|uniref:Uncharacterized protein n=1 Tax=Roridomyces roridus TaxID=1738132 RepID=A0AAD7F7L0_9AGAR|nr:hypothetical protein FB45DRAFT_882788 [Roridomyces roridus]
MKLIEIRIQFSPEFHKRFQISPSNASLESNEPLIPTQALLDTRALASGFVPIYMPLLPPGFAAFEFKLLVRLMNNGVHRANTLRPQEYSSEKSNLDHISPVEFSSKKSTRHYWTQVQTGCTFGRSALEISRSKFQGDTHQKFFRPCATTSGVENKNPQSSCDSNDLLHVESSIRRARGFLNQYSTYSLGKWNAHCGLTSMATAHSGGHVPHGKISMVRFHLIKQANFFCVEARARIERIPVFNDPKQGRDSTNTDRFLVNNSTRNKLRIAKGPNAYSERYVY